MQMHDSYVHWMLKPDVPVAHVPCGKKSYANGHLSPVEVVTSCGRIHIAKMVTLHLQC